MMRTALRFPTGLFVLTGLLSGQATETEQAALNHISAQSMRGHLSFIASDALEGRGTPSRGLDIAGEYIAAQFRRAGLEPAGANGSYFQVADFVMVNQKADEFRLTWNAAGEETQFGKADVLLNGTAADLVNSPIVRLPAENIAGKIVAGDAQTFQRRAAVTKLRQEKPALIILIAKRAKPNVPEESLQPADSPMDVPVVTLFGEKAAKVFESKNAATVSVHLATPERKPVGLRNVAGILRGSDPQLRDQFVILSAHYDHLGMRPNGSGDRIFNGANDNGSGTVSVVEIASALALLPVHPKRSILFLTFFGEEEGLLGAFYYTKHPLVQLAQTVVNINLEQMGRTDEQDGKEVNAFAFTGPSYSSVPKLMEEAAKPEHVHIYKKKDADAFFARSDNYAFAQAGIVDHTVVVAFEYPDYHAVGDEWEKVDYDNMARVDRAVAAGLIRIANAAERPAWTDAAATEPYRKAAPK